MIPRSARRAAEPAGPWPAAGRIFLLALALHAVVGFQYRHDPFADQLVGDALSYHRTAANLAERGLGAEPVFHQSPLLPVVLSWVYGRVEPSARILAGTVLLALLQSAAVALLVPLGQRCLGSRRAGLAAAAVGLLHGPLLFYGLKLLTIPLALVTQAVAVLAVARARRVAGPPAAALAGAACGLAALARAETLLFAPLALAALLLAPRSGASGSRAAAFVLGLVVAVSPVTLHNFRAGDRVLVAAAAGENLYVGNRRGAHGGHAGLDDRAGDIFTQREVAREEAERAAGRPLRPSEVSAYWRSRALGEITADPGAWLALELRKLGRVLHPGDPTDLYSFALERSRYLTALHLARIGPWTLLALGAVGISLAIRRRQQQAWPLAAMPAVHLVVMLVFFADTRLRLPLLFFLTPFAGLAVAEAWRNRRQLGRRLWLAAGIVLIAVLAVEQLATRAGPRDAVRLAAVLSMQNRLDEAVDVLGPELGRPDPDAYVLDQAGWVRQKQQRPGEARSLYERALATADLAPRRERQTRTRLGKVLELLGDLEGSLRQHDAAVAGELGNAGTYYERGRLRMRLGDRDGAVADLREAVRLDPSWPPPRRALERIAAENHAPAPAP